MESRFFEIEVKGGEATAQHLMHDRALLKGLRFLAVLGFAVSVFLIALGQIWVNALGDSSPVSVAAVCGLYYVMNRKLEKAGVTSGQSVVLAVLFANAFLQAFELVYHFTFPVYLDYFTPPFLNGTEVRYIAVEGSMLLPLLLVRRHLRFNYVSAILLVCFMATWALWILFGFPQYFVAGEFYAQIFISNDPFRLSLLLNFVAKSVLALFFASLVVESFHRSRTTILRHLSSLIQRLHASN